MLKKLLLPFVVLAFAAVLIAGQQANHANQSGQPGVSEGQSGDHSSQSDQFGGPQGRQEETIQGTIQKVDTVGNNVTIKTDNNEQETFSLDIDTSIKVNGKMATVADLKPGQQVTITLEGQKAVAVDVSDQSSPMTP